MKISIIIPNYNGKETLSKNLPHVLKSGAEEIIVVDDASTDESIKFLKENFSQIKILVNKKNLGFSSTANRGVEEANGEIVVLLNTDVSPNPDFLRPLIPHFTDPRVFAVGCLDESPEDGKIILRGRGIGKWEKGFVVHSRGEIDKPDTFWVAGGSGAFRKNLWQQLGGFDPLYNPFYWEDIDLSYRAQKAGYKILFEPKSRVVHKHAEGIIKKNYSSFYIKTIAYRNQFFFVWKNITDLGFLGNHIIWQPYYIIIAMLNLNAAYIFGFILALIKFPLVAMSHLRVKKLFKLKDKQLI